MPPWLRGLAASFWGFRLRVTRYGRDTERLVEEALERDRWSREAWRRWQDERLESILVRAARDVPYYRDVWRERAGSASPERLDDWPFLEKESVRAAPRRFVADDCDPDRMIHDSTSGTTGTPLDLWFRRRTVREWYALFEARCRRWYGVSRHDRWAIIGGQIVVPVTERRPPFWVWNAALNQLYLSAYHLAPDLIPHTLDAIVRHRVRYLLGYTSALYALAGVALEGPRRDFGLSVVVTNAEPLYDHQRRAISDAFGCPVRETYGMAELAAAASECESGRLHVWPEAGIVEVVEEGRKVAEGAAGEFLCTGLVNPDMPLVRYRVGDRGALGPAAELCACGRTLPLLEQVEGRVDDVLFTADGRAVGRLDPVFKADLGIREAQIIQESPEVVRLRYVPTAAFDDARAETIVERLRDRLGPVRVILDPVPEIPRERNGKFRAVISRVVRPR